jgi:hypothetical protein
VDEKTLLEFLKNWFESADTEGNYADIDDDGLATLDGHWDLNQLAGDLFKELQCAPPSTMVVLHSREAAEAFLAGVQID